MKYNIVINEKKKMCEKRKVSTLVICEENIQ